MGSIYYRFKSSKTSSRVNIDGTSLSVFDLKKEIILSNKMGKGNDFDLLLLRDTPSQEEYHDDNEMIPRSTSVIVKRSPPRIPNRGTAAKYAAEALISLNNINNNEQPTPNTLSSNTFRPTLSMRFDGKPQPHQQSNQHQQLLQNQSNNNDDSNNNINANDSEQDAIAAMFAASEQQWQETQQQMSQATPVYTNMRPQTRKPVQNATNSPSNNQQPSSSDKSNNQQSSTFTSVMPTPPGYVCYRCGEKGHWIQDCPTNGDPEFENKPRFKRTTGIPKSFLKTVDAATAAAAGNAGVMITPDGSHVIATPDSAMWERSRATKPRLLTVNDIRDKEPDNLELKCELSQKLINNPVIMPCCQKLYSEDYIQSYLIENDFFCPNCNQNVGSLDKLTHSTEVKNKVIDYINFKLQENNSQIESNNNDNNNKDGNDNNNSNNNNDDNVQKKNIVNDENENEIDRLNKMINDCQLAIVAILQSLQNPAMSMEYQKQFQQQIVQLNQVMQMFQSQLMMLMNGLNPKMMGLGVNQFNNDNTNSNNNINNNSNNNKDFSNNNNNNNLNEPVTGQKRQNVDQDDYNNSQPNKKS